MRPSIEQLTPNSPLRLALENLEEQLQLCSQPNSIRDNLLNEMDLRIGVLVSPDRSLQEKALAAMNFQAHCNYIFRERGGAYLVGLVGTTAICTLLIASVGYRLAAGQWVGPATLIQKLLAREGAAIAVSTISCFFGLTGLADTFFSKYKVINATNEVLTVAAGELEAEAQWNENGPSRAPA